MLCRCFIDLKVYLGIGVERRWGEDVEYKDIKFREVEGSIFYFF